MADGGLLLIGCQKLDEHGFALPVFGRACKANEVFVAVCEPEGDGQGRVARFLEFDSDGIEYFPPELVVPVAIGDSWTSIFYWNARPHIGSSTVLWDALAPVRDEIADQAPLSLLGLAFDADRLDEEGVAEAAGRFMAAETSEALATQWVERTIRRYFLVHFARLVVAEGLILKEVADDIELVRASDGDLEARIAPEAAKRLRPLAEKTLSGIRATLAAFASKARVVIQREQASPPPRGPVQDEPRWLRQWELIDRIRAYDPTADEKLLNRAYVYAMKMHGSQLRASGDPYFAHPIQVAGILARYKLDTISIVTALLHDVIEDTPATRADVEAHFGETIATLVEGVTKLSRLDGLIGNGNSEDYRKFILTTSGDLRVVLVKLADRLQAMRTLRYVKPEKREAIARETLEVYAPLGRGIGIHSLAAQLEELAFQHLNSAASDAIDRRLEALSLEWGRARAEFLAALTQTLDQAKISAKVSGRQRTAMSIWEALKESGAGFSSLTDIYSFTVEVETPGDGYHALGVIHRTWHMVPGHLRDTMSQARGGSLQTCVVGSGGFRTEIQILISPAGDSDPAKASAPAHRDPLGSLRSVVEAIDRGEGIDEDEAWAVNAKFDIYLDQVFVFTPKGSLVVLPRGSMPLDFAYAIHTSVGRTAVGVMINGELRPMRTQLHNGDVVEILRDDKVSVPEDWRSLTVTTRARSAIRRRLRIAERENFQRLGRAKLDAVFGGMTVATIRRLTAPVLDRFGAEDAEALADLIGRGKVSAEDVLEAATLKI